MSASTDAPVTEPTSDLPPTHDKPRMGEHCVSEKTNPGLSSSGEIVKLADTEIYISRPADPQNAALLILLTNAIGVHSVNNQVQADHFAAAGYFVIVPDLFNGDAFKLLSPAETQENENTTQKQQEQEQLQKEEHKPSLIERLKAKTVEGVSMFMVDMWIARHTPENTEPIIDKVLAAVKEAYADKEYAASLGTYAVGYCFGGKYALRLAGAQWKKHGILAAAVAHATLTTAEDFEAVEKPVILACVENDPYFADEIREKGRQILDAKKIDYQMEMFKGAPHGFGVFGSYHQEDIKVAQKKCFDQFVTFLNRH